MPRFILTNDDGIDAPGLDALFRAVDSLGERVVVAPDEVQSGVGHAVTTHAPISFTRRKENWYAVGGTPADCSRLALTHLAPGGEWVLSGINRGGNLGADVYISGTVAGAREAAFLGRPAIAFSQYVRPDLPVDWERSVRQCAALVRLLLARPPRFGAFWNVNLPHLPPGADEPEVVFCGLDHSPLDVRYRLEPTGPDSGSVAHFDGNYHARARQAGRDVEVCFSGRIAVTEIPLDIAG